jgi:hypothetical protein
MSNFAEIDENNTVIRVLVGDNTLPNEGKDWFEQNLGGTWVQTSYNANFRKNYAGVGFIYDPNLDAFIPPKPFSSWVLNKEICQWEAPKPYPTDGFTYVWNDNKGEWELVNFAEPNEELEA